MPVSYTHLDVYKRQGYISAEELSADPSVKPEDVVKVGDEIETYIIRVNDVEGYAMPVSYTHLGLWLRHRSRCI